VLGTFSKSRTHGYKKAPAQFDRGYEPLLKREDAFVSIKEEIRVHL
jgi:hypothetical protein